MDHSLFIERFVDYEAERFIHTGRFISSHNTSNIVLSLWVFVYMIGRDYTHVVISMELVRDSKLI